MCKLGATNHITAANMACITKMGKHYVNNIKCCSAVCITLMDSEDNDLSKKLSNDLTSLICKVGQVNKALCLHTK